MSGGAKWKPYVLSPGEFSQLVELLVEGNEDLQYIRPPNWVKNSDNWFLWAISLKFHRKSPS